MDQKSIQKCSQINDPWDTLFTERVSLIFAKGFAKKNIKPNFVTTLSIICGIIGGVFIAFHGIWFTIAGIFMEIFAAIFDAADGQVARMNHSGSRFGRFFDGFGDSVVQISIYLGVAVRLMSDPIPFTDTLWGWWSFLLVAPIGFYFHTRQCRVADYYKQIHMHMIGNEHSELEKSKNQLVEYKNMKSNLFGKLIFKTYISYTKTQERETPQTQKLLLKLEQNNDVIPENISEMYMKNTKWTKLTNLLVFNLRSYTLFILLLIDCFLNIGLVSFYFPFVVLILEPLCLIIEYRFEHLAKKAIAEGFNK